MRRPFSCSLFVAVVFCLVPQPSARASWAETGLHTLDTVEFATGIDQASEILCVSLAPDVGHTEARRASHASCRSSMQAILEGHFERPVCRTGGLYITALDACLDAIVVAMLEGPSCSEGDGSAARLHLHEAIAEACSPDEICRSGPAVAGAP